MTIEDFAWPITATNPTADRSALRVLHVVEAEDDRWLAGTDGYRLHAVRIGDRMEVGCYEPSDLGLTKSSTPKNLGSMLTGPLGENQIRYDDQLEAAGTERTTAAVALDLGSWHLVEQEMFEAAKAIEVQRRVHRLKVSFWKTKTVVSRDYRSDPLATLKGNITKAPTGQFEVRFNLDYLTAIARGIGIPFTMRGIDSDSRWFAESEDGGRRAVIMPIKSHGSQSGVAA